MDDRLRSQGIAALVGVVATAAWLYASWRVGVVIGWPSPVGQWTLWTWPPDPDPSLSFVGPFMGGAGMIVLAGSLLFAIALIGAWRQPLVSRVDDD